MTTSSHRERLLALVTGLPRHLDGLVLATPLDRLSGALHPQHLAIDLQLGPTRFCIVHSATPPLDAVATVECHLGPVPQRNAAATYRQLLKINQRWAPLQPAGFGLDQERNTLIFSSQLDIANADTPFLIAVMEGGARLALMGGVGHLLEPPVTAARSTLRNHAAFERA